MHPCTLSEWYICWDWPLLVGSFAGCDRPSGMAGLHRFRARACRVAPHESIVKVIQSTRAILKMPGRLQQGFPEHPGRACALRSDAGAVISCSFVSQSRHETMDCHVELPLQGFIWGINSFDQWGVELGKVLAAKVRTNMNSARTVHRRIKQSDGFNHSTTRLLNRSAASHHVHGYFSMCADKISS